MSPFTLDKFDDFFRLLPDRADSDRRWTVTWEERVWRCLWEEVKEESSMPFKDIEKRRACSREGKRRARKRQAHPLHRFRVYPCARFPGLNIGLASFDGGFLIVDVVARPDIKARVERHPEYGRYFPLCIMTHDHTHE